MNISNGKKQLAKIISENGGWRDGATWAAQDGIGNDGLYNVAAYGAKPVYDKRMSWHKPSDFSAYHEDWFRASSPLKNFHQTILSRDEYFHLYPAPDAVAEQKAEIRWVRGAGVHATPTAHDRMEMLKEKWDFTKCGCDECAAFYAKSAPEMLDGPTIEQLAADYKAKLAIAQLAQEEADSHRCGAEAALERLYQAGLAIGLDIAIADDTQEYEE